MYIRDRFPNVTFAPIPIDFPNGEYRVFWMANLRTFKRMVARDATGYFTFDADNERLDINLADILACIPKGHYNKLVNTLPTVA